MQTIWIIANDDAVRKSLAALFDAASLRAAVYPDFADVIEHLNSPNPDRPGCIVIQQISPDQSTESGILNVALVDKTIPIILLNNRSSHSRFETRADLPETLVQLSTPYSPLDLLSQVEAFVKADSSQAD